jgi:mannose-6-phosphate isomerase-like protein (cupin superfamily)
VPAVAAFCYADTEEDGLRGPLGLLLTDAMDQPLFRRAGDCRVSRISPADTNKFVMTVDPVADKSPFLSVVEIFEAGGKTPLHHHEQAHEMFYVLSGRGRAVCGGRTYDMAKGDTLVLPPGMEHVVENVGTDRLYCLTVMVPNEGLAELIRAGATMALDAADRAIVSES